MATNAQTLRADARANRQRILDAARHAFAENSDASLNSIARTAGVGAGTLYRHFPTREALVLAVHHMEIENLAMHARTLAKEHPPAQAFRLWCGRLADFVRVKRGFAEVLQAAMSVEDLNASYGTISDALGAIIVAGEKSGEFRPGTDPMDIFLALSFHGWIRSPAGEARAKRLIELILRGLKTE